MRKRLGLWFAWHPVRTNQGWRWLTHVDVQWVDIHDADHAFIESGYWTVRAVN
jgi:hypothetical protein